MVRNRLRIHITNISGEGALKLVNSLVPEFEKLSSLEITALYVPSKGPLHRNKSLNSTNKFKPYKRWLPNGLSRILECTVYGKKFSGPSALLVLGDLPIRCDGRQFVFIQTRFLCMSNKNLFRQLNFRYLIASYIFKLNSKRVEKFFVQTEIMKMKLSKKYSISAEKVKVIPQPPPSLLISRKIVRTKRADRHRKIHFFYPASFYRYKNHDILSKLSRNIFDDISEIVLTIDYSKNPAPDIKVLNCVGKLEFKSVIEIYGYTDCLLFLSKEESYGFPLVEAMFVGLPIICPNLPYSRLLCGESAIYFEPKSAVSLENAIHQLKLKLNEGWWPDWSEAISKIPKSWHDTASSFAENIFNKNTIVVK